MRELKPGGRFLTQRMKRSSRGWARNASTVA
jgi:hypothetical protein